MSKRIEANAVIDTTQQVGGKTTLHLKIRDVKDGDLDKFLKQYRKEMELSDGGVNVVLDLEPDSGEQNY